jgi:hypothetical protein
MKPLPLRTLLCCAGSLILGCDPTTAPVPDPSVAAPAPILAGASPATPTWTIRDRDAVRAVIDRAEKDPTALLELDGNPFPPAAAWRRFFASVGYAPATPSRSAPGSPNETFADLIQSFDDAESPGPWPCWVSYRWPTVWAAWAIKNPTLARNKEMICEAPLRDARVTRDYGARMNRAQHKFWGPLSWRCGNVVFAYEQDASVLMTALWYDPRGFAAMKLLRGDSNDIDESNPLASTAPVPSPEELLGDQAPPAAWLRYVEAHLTRTHHLSRRDARAVSLRLADHLVEYSYAMHAACGSNEEAVAAREELEADGVVLDGPPEEGWVPYGVKGSKITKPEGVFGFW